MVLYYSSLVLCVLVLFPGLVIQYFFFLVKFCVSGLVFFCVGVFLFWVSTCFCFLIACFCFGFVVFVFQFCVFFVSISHSIYLTVVCI